MYRLNELTRRPAGRVPNDGRRIDREKSFHSSFERQKKIVRLLTPVTLQNLPSQLPGIKTSNVCVGDRRPPSRLGGDAGEKAEGGEGN